MIPSWFKSAWAVLADLATLLVRYFKNKDANEIPDAVQKARNDSASGDDNSLNADLDAARDRMLDNQSRSNKQ